MNYPLTIPSTVKPNQESLGIKTNHLVHASVETFKQQVVERSGKCWTLSLSFPPQTIQQTRALRGFLTQLNGRLGTFYYAPMNPVGGTAAGSIVVSNVVDEPLRTKITLSGGTGAGCLKVGDLVQIGTQLVSINTDYNGGTQQVEIFPHLRSSPTGNAPVITSNPKGVFRLTTPDIGWVLSISRLSSFSIDAIEAF